MINLHNLQCLLLNLLIKSFNLKLIGLLGEMNYLLYFNGNVGKEKKRRNEENTNGCLKRKNIVKREKIWKENTSENLKEEEVSFKISKKITYEKCKIIGKLDMMKK